MKIIKVLNGASPTNRLEVVEIDGEQWVLKTADSDELENERAFSDAMNAAGLPTLTIKDEPSVGNDALLLEYVEGSPTIGGRISPDIAHKWGRAVRMMHDISALEPSYYIAGSLHKLDWTAFLQLEICDAQNRQRTIEGGLDESDIQKFLDRSVKLMNITPETWSLVHADLHSNNAMVRGEDVVLFDKGSAVFYGDPWYDLVTIAMEFPASAILVPGSHANWKAFLEGYGARPDLHKRKYDDFLAYALLRAVGRYPNKFVPELGTFITYLLNT